METITKYKGYEIYYVDIDMFAWGLGFLAENYIVYLDSMPYETLNFFIDKKQKKSSLVKPFYDEIPKSQLELLDKAIDLYEKNGLPKETAFKDAYKITLL